ncbi:MAG TPA: AAA family ATPase [Roseiflexaceae bacterium]|nr:AAA family ATPase [Roseiflexaceae bacterium]
MAREHKQGIAASFAHMVDDDVPDVDQRLVQIRLKLEPTYGQGFSFYEDRLKVRWLETDDSKALPDESIAQMSPSEVLGSTAADIGLSGMDQIRLALQAIINKGGTATIQDIYEAVENAMSGNVLSHIGKSSLRFFINSVAVKNGYLHPYDRNKPGWHITPQGRQFVELSDAKNITQMEQKGATQNNATDNFLDTSGVSDRPDILPRTLGEKLRPYVELVTHLGASTYTASQIVDRLGQIKPAIANLTQAPNAETLIADLMRLRLLEHLEDGRYRRWAHLSDATVDHMLRYAALTLLVPAGEEYDLPALDAPFDGLPHPPAVWPLQGAILSWYEEAGLVRRNEDGTWQSHPGALDSIDAQTPTASALNTFLDHLRRARVSPRDLPPLDDVPLQPIDQHVLDERVAEIQRELLIDRDTILRIYRSLIAGQHVILSGPPGTGKTHLARILPRILWRDAQDTVMLHMPMTPELPPTADPDDEVLRREGYAVEVVTATEDWGVRHVIGGIAPQLQLRDQVKTLIYSIRHGHLTRAVLTNYQAYDGETIPALDRLKRYEPIDAQERRYHGHWLVIDEFTRAQIDAAFGSLLTTLGGQRSPTIAVPTDDGGERHVPLPRDFRLIGTLNSFDRHFLNQMSEAMKRRFAFIDILPPGRADAEHEQALAIFRALLRLSENRLGDITADETAGVAAMPGVLSVRREEFASDGQTHIRYYLDVQDDDAQAALHSFWRLFSAIRLYRQLGTAQAESIYAALLTGRSIHMTWSVALDSALADTLADQLQVLARDEQRVLLAAIEHAADPQALTTRIIQIMDRLPGPRQSAHLSQLKAHEISTAPRIDDMNPASLDVEQVRYLFGVDTSDPAMLPSQGLFANRLRAFVNERGL